MCVVLDLPVQMTCHTNVRSSPQSVSARQAMLASDPLLGSRVELGQCNQRLWLPSRHPSGCPRVLSFQLVRRPIVVVERQRSFCRSAPCPIRAYDQSFLPYLHCRPAKVTESLLREWSQ